MTTIHLEPEIVSAAARRMRHGADDLQQEAAALRRSIQRVDMNWQSPRADRYVAKAKKVQRRLALYSEELEALCLEMEREVAQWLAADHLGPDQMRGGRGRLRWDVSDLLDQLLALLKMNSQTAMGLWIAQFLWFADRDRLLQMGDQVISLISTFLANKPLTWYNQVGKLINRWIVDNLHGGWQGRMKDFGRILKSPVTQGVLTVFGILINFLTDPDREKDPLNAFEVAVAQGGVETGISATGVGGVVLLVNAGVQLFGNLSVEGLKQGGRWYGGGWTTVMNNQANRLDDNFDRIDLTNITHELGHWIVDDITSGLEGKGGGFLLRTNLATTPIMLTIETIRMLTKSPETIWNENLANLENNWNHVKNLGGILYNLAGGLVELPLNLTKTRWIELLASFQGGVDIAPIPGEWKQSVELTLVELAGNIEAL